MLCSTKSERARWGKCYQEIIFKWPLTDETLSTWASWTGKRDPEERIRFRGREMSKSGGPSPENQPHNQAGLEKNTVTRRKKTTQRFRQPTQGKIGLVLP